VRLCCGASWITNAQNPMWVRQYTWSIEMPMKMYEVELKRVSFVT
jgi:hypothetical protein